MFSCTYNFRRSNLNSSDLGCNYSELALKRFWRVQLFSNFMTRQFHKRFEKGSFDNNHEKAQFDYIIQSEAMRMTIAKNYTGLKDL